MLRITTPLYKTYGWLLEREVKKDTLPEHIGIIMDGNRRLAGKMGLHLLQGHRLGAKKIEDVLDWCFEMGIKTVTAYAFSTENFLRPKEEVEVLFDLFEEYFRRVGDMERIHQRGVRVKAIGRVEAMPERVRKAIEYAEERTKDYDNFYLNLAVAYGGRQEVLDAVKKIAQEVREGTLEVDHIDEGTISDNLYTNGHKDPDLIIRTSGEERISGFLLWQSAYSELYFCDAFWPGFRKIDLMRAIRTYQQRKRRFGR